MSFLFEVKGHELVDLKGNKSTFYRINPPDLEQVDQKRQEQIYQTLESDLMNTESPLKFYFLEGNLYLNSFGDFSLRDGDVTPCKNPLEIFFSETRDKAEIYENYLTLGTEYIRLLCVKEFPTHLMRQETTNWPDFVLSCKKIPTSEAKAKIDLKRKLHFSLLFKGIRDLESEGAYSEAEEILSGLTQGEKAIFQVEAFFIIRAESKKSLDQKTNRIISDFKGQGAELSIEDRGLSYFYESLIPGVLPSLKRAMIAPSDYLSYLIPYHRSFLMETGLELRARGGADLYLDTFSEEVPNYNTLITGESGQGKSMMANKILAHELSLGAKAMILDLGHSFEKTAKYFKGNILSEKFNPLQFRDARYLKEFILAALEETLSKREEGKLFEVVENALKDYEGNSFMVFLEYVEESFPGLKYCFKEIEAFFTDELLALNNLTYCDMSNYPEVIKAPLIIYLIEYFKNLEGRRTFIFDECWHLLDKNASYISTCFRTFRKHLASAVAISQSLDDFLRSPLGAEIARNSHFKFFFRQVLGASEFLTPYQKTLLDSISSVKGHYSEFLIVTENFTKPAQYFPTPLEYELFTSDRRDNNQFEHYLSEKAFFLPFEDAIQNFVQIKYPYGRMDA